MKLTHAPEGNYSGKLRFRLVADQRQGPALK